MTTPAWHDDAACADDTVDPDWFFPDKPGLAGLNAKRICGGCEVREQCLAVALRQPWPGIWGGTSESQRVRMRREQGIELPQRWAAHNGRSRWEDRYYEMVELGYTQVEIAQRWGIQPRSMERQLHRYGIPVSDLLLAEKIAARSSGRAS